MNGEKPRGLLHGHPTRYASAQIAALCDVVVVTQARHQRCPCVRNARKTPPRFCRFVRQAKPGERGNYDVKGFIGFTTVGRRVHERSNDLHKLDDRPGPAMGQYDWQSILVLRSDVNEVNTETVNLAAKLWKPIQCAFNATPIIVGAPVFSERLRFGQRYTLGPVR